MHEVFISYSSKDQLTADTACAVLEQNGIRCWVAPRDVLPGMSWGGSIIDAINSARVMVLVFSDHANKSPQVERKLSAPLIGQSPLFRCGSRMFCRRSRWSTSLARHIG